MKNTKSTDSTNPESRQPSALPEQEEREVLYARSYLYRLISQALAYPRREIRELCGEEVRRRASEAAGLLGSEELSRALEVFMEQMDESSVAEMEAAYNRLCLVPLKCSFYETDYCQHSFIKAKELADVSGFYRAFKVELSVKERPDFICTELEFMGLLLLKEVYALDKRWKDQAAVCREAGLKFFKDHLAWWIPKFCSKLRKESSLGYYSSVASLLEKFMESEERHVKEKS
ncbi:TorD/DmsD family molecular chaperone [Candidatus Hecatella orcuttiae]|jgi:TorA maturation chaperone TorD|uniref:TorD/DmsD family molecular chaperone n=1 Tax=Candidatus Hecatella orcuttiae TaxID=1935119 RepID=UPI002867DD6A|nr:molecular chaperone TorD family protein [Candidatus Hecatella orcuttiae]